MNEDQRQELYAFFSQERETVRMALALDGRGMVMLGGRTSKMSKSTFSEYIEFLHAAAVEHGVTVYRDQA